MPDTSDRPVLIELDDAAHGPTPADVPPVAEVEDAPTGRAMQTLAALSTRPSSPLAKWFWRLLLWLILFVAGIAAWEFLAGLVARSPVLAAIAIALIGLFLTTCLAIVIKELSALGRLRRIDRFQKEAMEVRASGDLAAARGYSARLGAFYRDRSELKWGLARLEETTGDQFDAETVFLAIEDNLIAPLDTLATREVEAAARQVATVTALVPLAFADIISAFVANLRMIRRVAQIYGGRAGTLGSWRLTRAVVAHLVATGAVAVGDDLIGSVGGGHVLAKISRRFGEGLVNGALTARVGVAAIEVCRPLPFSPGRRPRVTTLVRRALTGLFESGGSRLTETSSS
ncbi:MAG: YcjF family protein [Silicimonas sp.]|nr:YcjF family protein [Silicimonas sp.]